MGIISHFPFPLSVRTVPTVLGWWVEEAIFGRISHHPFGPQCSREFATLHISCRKQQFPSLPKLYMELAGWLARMLFAPRKRQKNARYHLIVFIYDYYCDWDARGGFHNSTVLLGISYSEHKPSAARHGGGSGGMAAATAAPGWMGGWVNDRLTSSMGLFQTAFDWRCCSLL